MNDKLVSVIITTKNEEANIENCLRSIKAQSYLSRRSRATLGGPQDKIEIIVGDNNSVDRTKEIALEYTDNPSEIASYFTA
ncbi:MAG: glycosyltransferase family 2 protein [Candidatus Omnitrophota bacterium]